MKLAQLLEQLNQLAKERPEALEREIMFRFLEEPLSKQEIFEKIKTSLLKYKEVFDEIDVYLKSLPTLEDGIIFPNKDHYSISRLYAYEEDLIEAERKKHLFYAQITSEILKILRKSDFVSDCSERLAFPNNLIPFLLYWSTHKINTLDWVATYLKSNIGCGFMDTSYYGICKEFNYQNGYK